MKKREERRQSCSSADGKQNPANRHRGNETASEKTRAKGGLRDDKLVLTAQGVGIYWTAIATILGRGCGFILPHFLRLLASEH